MGLQYFFFLLPFILAQIQEEDNVWVLTDVNFNEALQKQPDLLVDFYAPWCGHCKTLAPEYAKAAKKLKEHDPPVRIGKVDATTNPRIAEQYGINSYPTLKYFINKKAIEYTGERTSDSIVNWILNKVDNGVKTMLTLQSLQVLIEKSKVAVVLFAQKGSSEMSQLVEASKHFDNVQFILSTDTRALNHYNVQEPSIVLFKKHDDFKTVYNSVDGDLTEWVAQNKRPWSQKFDDEAAGYLFKQGKPGIILFKSESDKSYDTLWSELGKAFNKDLAFIYADITLPDNYRLGNYLGVSSRDYPVILIIEEEGEKKHRFTSSINESNIRTFINNWKSGQLGSRGQGMPMATNNNNNANNRGGNKVTVLTASNYDSIVNDKTKNVLVDYYAPWCGPCQALEPEIVTLASKFTNDSIVIAKIDMTSNTIRNLNINAYPTLKFFPAADKKPVEYEGDRAWEALFQFVNDYASQGTQNKRLDL